MAITTTAGGISPGQTILRASGRVTLSATLTTTVPLGTIPAGKTWFLTDLMLSTVATAEIDCSLQYTLSGNTVTIFEASITSTAPCDACGIESQPTVPAGATLQLVFPSVTGPPKVDFFVAGFCQIPVT